jgi:hypothetical protein
VETGRRWLAGVARGAGVFEESQTLNGTSQVHQVRGREGGLAPALGVVLSDRQLEINNNERGHARLPDHETT